MKFFFCENCGKRITDFDLAEGRARDKQAKGIYCQACNESVMTMEFAAIQLPIAGQPASSGVRKDPQTRDFASRKGTDRKQTSGPLPGELRRHSRTGQPAAIRMVPVITGIVAALTVALISLAVMYGSERSVQRHADSGPLPVVSNSSTLAQQTQNTQLSQKTETLKTLEQSPATKTEILSNIQKPDPIQQQHEERKATVEAPNIMPVASQPIKIDSSPQLQTNVTTIPDADQEVTAARATYAKFWETYFLAIREYRMQEARDTIEKAEKNAALARMQDALAQDRKLLTWLSETEDAFSSGLLKLKETESFELRTVRGQPILVGTDTPLQFIKVKDRKLFVGSKGMDMPIPLDDLQPETKGKLAKLGLGSDAVGHFHRAFVDWLMCDLGANQALFEQARVGLGRAKRAGASAEDIAYLEDKLNLTDKAARDAAESAVARDAWKPIEAQTKGTMTDALCKALVTQIAAWRKAHGTTGFAHDNEAKIAETEKMLLAAVAPLLIVQFGKDAKTNKFGLKGWDTVFMDMYNSYSASGPGGTMVVGAILTNGEYDYQGIAGPPYTFHVGDQIIVTIANVAANELAFTPRIAFDYRRRPEEKEDAWHNLSTCKLAPGEVGTATFTFDANTANDFGAISVNMHYLGNANSLMCHKIELKVKR